MKPISPNETSIAFQANTYASKCISQTFGDLALVYAMKFPLLACNGKGWKRPVWQERCCNEFLSGIDAEELEHTREFSSSYLVECLRERYLAAMVSTADAFPIRFNI